MDILYIYSTINQFNFNILFNIPVLFITEKCDTAGTDGIGTICKHKNKSIYNTYCSFVSTENIL